MNIEALYPYIAVAYGTFGLVFGLFLWTKTRGYIFGTKAAIETQVANAVKDIRTQVDEKLDGFDDAAIDLAPVMAAFDEKFAAWKEELPDEMAKHFAMHYKSIQATEAKQFKKILEEVGVDIDAAGEEAREFVENQLPPELRLVKDLMTKKIPKSIRDEHPTATWLADNTRLMGGQMILNRLQTQLGGGVAVEGVQEVARSRGFGVR